MKINMTTKLIVGLAFICGTYQEKVFDNFGGGVRLKKCLAAGRNTNTCTKEYVDHYLNIIHITPKYA